MKIFDRLFGKMIDRRIAAYQNYLLEKHCEEIENTYRIMRGWRHDYHNHVQTMLALCDNPTEMREYLLKLDSDLKTVDTVIKTGNVMVDAILNSKLSLIKSHNIPVNAKAVVPENLSISEVDLCSIIGNLLDNAMEACINQPENEERYIRVYIGVMKKQLYISVQNSAGEIKKAGKSYLSLKNKAGHCYGISRIDAIAERNGGYVNRQNEEGVFATEVMLPLPSNSCQK